MSGSCNCEFVEPLLQWWWRSRRPRDYPWRQETDPYRVLVAEILLQRTRRDKAAEVYREFISLFPDPQSLSNASENKVRNIIRPLGLEKRAPYLIKLAREILQRPHVLQEGRFEELPGVGPYVASATRVILGLPTRLKPDTSIARVFSRLYDRPLRQQRPADTPWVEECLNKCIPRNSELMKEYFLALVDLAWEICKPRKPSCTECPLKHLCEYNRHKA